MKIVNNSFDNELSVLGGYQYRTKGKKYRFNKFCLKVETEEGTLIRNYLTGAIVLLKPMELMNLETTDPCDYVDFLIGNWFLVPEDYDEESIVKIMRNRQVVPLTDTYLDHPSHFTIFTTTTCNARCFYCYELKSKGKTPMSLEMAEKVAKYIIGYAPRDRQIILDWFGGEPLYNPEVIDLICSRVASAGFNMQSSMISNGYLFNDKMIEKAVNDWNLKGVQITLDGTEEVYNKTKNYIYKEDESPFKTVIANMHKLLQNGITINVRMNCDKHNYEDLINLVDYLYEEFPEPNISYYVWPVFNEGSSRTDEENDKLYEALIKIEKRIFEHNQMIGTYDLGQVKGSHCMIDSGDAVCIYPRGEISVCEHYLEDHFVSHIDNPNKKNWDILKAWRDYLEPNELCKDCPIRPSCLRAKGCTDGIPCFPKKKEFHIDHHKLAIISMYNSSKNQNNGQCNCGKQICNDCPEHKQFCDEHYPTQSGQWRKVMSDGTIIPIKSYQ